MTRGLLHNLKEPAAHAANGIEPLTAREADVLKLLARGYSNREVAAQLSISVRTVEGHRSSIMEKLGAESRADLVRYCEQRGLLDEPPRT